MDTPSNFTSFLSLYDFTFLTSLPLIQFVFYLAFICLLISAGSTWSTVGFDISRVARKLPLLKNYGLQSCQAGLGAFLFFMALLAGVVPLPGGEETALIGSPFVRQAIPFPAIMLLMLIFTLVFRTKLPNTILGPFFALLSSLLMLFYIFWWQAYGLSELSPSGAYEDPLLFALRSYESLQNASFEAFYISFLNTLFAALAIASIFKMLWLMLRRNWDNFGRDYYNYAMRKSARRSLFFIVVNTSIILFLFWSQHLETMAPFIEKNLLFITIMIFATLMSLFLCIVIARSATPMRHKFSAISVLAFYAMVLIGQFVITPFMPLCFLP